jgi:SAM-dependent methyltransferase
LQVPFQVNIPNSISFSFNFLIRQFSFFCCKGNLPPNRIERKCQQLENIVYIFDKLLLSISKQACTIVDFCSGGGHLAILLAYLYPNVCVKLIENKEESLAYAIKRIESLKLKNCNVYKGNLTNFIGDFDIGVSLHSCGSLTDMIIEKCADKKAALIVAPCCYGSIKHYGPIKYPRSKVMKEAFSTIRGESQYYFNLTNYADRTEKLGEYEKCAYECMNLIDADRMLHMRDELGYEKVKLFKMKPEDCTSKNNIIVALPIH